MAEHSGKLGRHVDKKDNTQIKVFKGADGKVMSYFFSSDGLPD